MVAREDIDAWRNGNSIGRKISVFWDITSCSPLKVNRCIGGTCRRIFRTEKRSQARKQHEAGSKQSLNSFVVLLLHYYKLTVVVSVLLRRAYE
jgi:hypothetical protein